MHQIYKCLTCMKPKGSCLAWVFYKMNLYFKKACTSKRVQGSTTCQPKGVGGLGWGSVHYGVILPSLLLRGHFYPPYSTIVKALVN